MTNQQKKVPKKQVALKLSKSTVPQIIADTKHYVQSMTGNPNFPSPSPSLTAVSNQLAALETAYATGQTRVKGSVSKMRAELKKHEILLKNLASYVETIANADPDNAENIILSAGMDVKKPRTLTPKTFSVNVVKGQNAVVLNTKAQRGAIYTYEMTTDPNTATSWTLVVSDNRVKYLKTGLTSGTRYYFRVMLSMHGVPGTWSPVLNVIIP